MAASFHYHHRRRSLQLLPNLLRLYTSSSKLHLSPPRFRASPPCISFFPNYTLSSPFSTDISLKNDNIKKNNGGFPSFDPRSNLVSQFRWFSNSRVSSDPSDSEFESGIEFGETEKDGSGGGKDQHKLSIPVCDMEDVLRVSRVVEELFSEDRSMEAVLDNCGVKLNQDLVLHVLNRFCHARKPAIRFFTWAGRSPGYQHNSTTYNKMIDILGKARQFETITVFLEEMGVKGLLTMASFGTAVRYFAAGREKKRAVGCLALMKKHGFKVGVDFINHLLHNLCKAKLVKEAYALSQKLKYRCVPDLRTYSILLNGWFMLRNLAEAVTLWNMMGSEGVNPDIGVHNIMLEGLIKCGRGEKAYELIKVMKARGPSPNVRSYTVFIKELCRRGRMKKAVALFGRMVSAGCLPDRALYTCMITGFGKSRRMDKVCWVLREMREMGCPPDGRTYDSLIKLMGDRRMGDDVVKVYREMVGAGIRPTLFTFNMMMKSLFRDGEYEMGGFLWEEMRSKGCCPDENAYTVFITGLIRHGRGAEACKYVMEMIDRGMRLPPLDFHKLACLVDREEGTSGLQEEMAQLLMVHANVEISKLFSSPYGRSRRVCVS